MLPVNVAPTTGVPLIVGTAVFTGAVCGFAAEVPLAKKPRSAASTPAAVTQVFRDPPTAENVGAGDWGLVPHWSASLHLLHLERASVSGATG
jgi:hypothetical protein